MQYTIYRKSTRATYPLCKTYRPALLIENKKLIKIVGFIGNDLETSVLLFSVSFCIIDKNAFCIAKVYKKTDFLRPVNKKVKTATIFVVKTRS